MYQLIDPAVQDVRNRASVMKIVHNMNEVLSVFQRSTMLSIAEQEHVKMAHGELQALIDSWLVDAQIELDLNDRFETERQAGNSKQRKVTAKTQTRAVEALLEMLSIYHDDKKMPDHAYTAVQQGHILVAVQNLLDALGEFDSKLLEKVLGTGK